MDIRIAGPGMLALGVSIGGFAFALGGAFRDFVA
jgi:hypothetical protein